MADQANGAEPIGRAPLMNAQLQVLAGYQQVGEEMWVTLSISMGPMTTALAVPISIAKDIARRLREAADTAGQQIIKPPSALVGSGQA
jgi:uncharacterized membrane protein